VEDHLITITAPNTDFSDFNGFAQASSLVSSALRLGAESEAEAALTGNATADADDTTGLDDEDGVTQGTLRANQAGTLNVRVTNTSGAPAYLNVWADWNRNNAVDSGEQLAADVVIATGSVGVDRVLNVTPAATVATGTLPLRARLTSTLTPGFSNAFPASTTGEVEDHLITISPPNQDFGDYSGFAGAASITSDTLRMGALVEPEVSITANAAADADDTTGLDDEDGVTQSALRANQDGVITVRVTNTSGSVAYLNVWADWNKNDSDGFG
jgi:hypothetical protein